MSLIDQNRVHAGLPAGGQFASHDRSEDEITLGASRADALRAARTALRQQQRHIAQLVRALDPIPTPRRRRVAA